MYLVEQQERLASSAAKPISWGRHGYCEMEKDATLRIRSSAKGISQKLGGVNGSVGEGSGSTFPPTISPSLNLSIRSLFMMLGAPTLTTLFVYSCDKYQCTLAPGIWDLLASTEGIHGVYDLLMWSLSPLRWFTWKALAIYMVWYTVQAIMYAVVPSKIGYGQKTLAGRELPYKLNGLTCYIITHIVFLSAVYLDVIQVSIIAQNWLGLFVAANFMGYFLTVFAYVKAHLFPCHPDDRKFSGSLLYDMFMGVEFNPRLGELWDFKLFHNGRPGIIAWTLIDISFCFSASDGTFTKPSIPALLVLLLHFIYVIDFFWHEDWYLRTIDIAHDHFGFYLAWGDSVWLPFMYTAQAQYLHHNQNNLGSEQMWLNLAVLVVGLGGYAVFRGSNNQKDYVRRIFSSSASISALSTTSNTSPETLANNTIATEVIQKNVRIWGKKPTYILAPYQTADGKWHTSLLLTSGYWGLARHMNYFGDICMATAMGLATMAVSGGPGFVGWWYTLYLITLLVHRTRRCDLRCSAKYGEKWIEYRKVVRWRILPGVY